MVTVFRGLDQWSRSRDAEGHRTYKARYKVWADAGTGPAAISLATGLPQTGDTWNELGDFDIWAWCRADENITPAIQEEKGTVWFVEKTFSTKPPDPTRTRPQDNPIENPLLEPFKISGRGNRFTEEATEDRFGVPILTSSLEPVRGAQVEFDKSRHVVRIEQNVAVLGIETFVPMEDTVNDRPLWGLPRRCWKLAPVQWERKYYAKSQVYYTRSLEFESNAYRSASGVIVSGWDRDLMDEGSKVLHGHWHPTTGAWVLDNIGGAAPQRNNAAHFDRFKDRSGELGRVILNGAGQPAYVPAAGATYYVSTIASNLNNPLYSGLSWVAVVGPLTPIAWQDLAFYQAGQLVTLGGVTYLALEDSNNSRPPNDDWLAVTLRAAGVYSTATSYAIGDYVTDTTDAANSAGTVHVEKYGESNFYTLGIPSIL
jgi:hypothetical protein